MKTQAILATLVFALGAGSASANDFTIDAGILTQDAAHPYAHLFTHEVGSFTDTIDFIVTGGSLGSSANPLNLTLGSTSVYSLSNLAYSVWSGTSSTSGAWFGTFVGGNISYDIGLTAPGAYHILVNGTADGAAGGAYGLSLVSGVPEPETYGMLLAGLGMMGLIARRKNRRAATPV